MRRAQELLPGMLQRYKGDPMTWDEMRADDAREAPDAVRDAHSVMDETIAGVRCTWLDQDRRGNGLIISLHGGGYIVGPGAAHWGWFSALCERTGMAGLLIRYSRAPEAAYPTALNEVLAVVRTLPDDWHLIGDSAGAGLGVAATMHLRDAGERMPRSMVLSSPWLDITMAHPDEVVNAHIDPMMGIAALDRYARAYAGTADRRDPGLSPLYGDPTGLPPMHITVGTAELFLFEIRDWKASCDAVGTVCDLAETEGAIHDFAIMLSLMPEAREALPAQAAFLAAHRA